jgi:hypothetical protein
MKKYESMVSFLKEVLPSDASLEYGYPRTAKKLSNGAAHDVKFAYELTTCSVKPAVGQRLLSKSDAYTVVVQADYAKDCYDWLMKMVAATEGTNVEFISSSVRKEPGVETGCIGSVVLSLYSGS